MKKSIIAAGAASVALAAMPIVGVFADSTGYVVDNITATITDGCTISRASVPTGGEVANFARGVAFSVVAGTSVTDQASPTVTLTCSASGWNVTAKGTGANGATLLYKDTTDSIQAGTETSGDTSKWAYKVDGVIDPADTATAIVGNYAAITASDVAVITAAQATANTATFTPSYQVFAQADQAAGAYVGQVTYTVNMPAV